MNPSLDLADIQGIVLFAYREHRAARFLFLRIHQAQRARAWLRHMGPKTRRAAPEDARHVRGHNLAFTANGLAALGLSNEALRTFSREFRHGMGDPERARVLGDAGESAPDRWEVGGPSNGRVDVLLMLYARDQPDLERFAAEEEARLEAVGLSVVHRIHSSRLPGDHEHFGFKDGLAQPRVEGAPARSETDGPGARELPVRAGEFLFGYANAYDQRPTGPSIVASEDPSGALAPLEGVAVRRDLGLNGTYLVIRKIQQHVGAFWSYLAAQARPGRDAEWLASRLVGRHPDGTPLARGTHPDGGEFGFGEDLLGRSCPLGAHIRRANPRDSLLGKPDASLVAVRRHRLVRRGRVYGPPLADPRSGRDDGVDRGLVFIGLNTSIARQFEFVQQTWVKSSIFASLHGEDDPLIGQRLEGLGSFTIQREPVRERLVDMPRFVTMRGGGYFFVPSMRALSFLARTGDRA